MLTFVKSGWWIYRCLESFIPVLFCMFEIFKVSFFLKKKKLTKTKGSMIFLDSKCHEMFNTDFTLNVCKLVCCNS